MAASITDLFTDTIGNRSAANDDQQSTDVTVLLGTVDSCLKSGNTGQMVMLLHQENKRQTVIDALWDLVPKLCQAMDDCTNEVVTGEYVSDCEKALLDLVDIVSAKELLILVLEQADMLLNDDKYKVLLTVTQKCLLNLPGKKGQSLSIAIETLYAYIETLPQPSEHDMEGEETKLLANDDDVRKMTDAILAMIQFMEPFVDCIPAASLTDEEKASDMRITKKAIVDTVFEILDQCLGYLDLTLDTSTKPDSKADPKSDSRLCAERLMSLVNRTQPDIIKLISNVLDENKRIAVKERRRNIRKNEGLISEEDDHEIEEPIPEFSLAVLSYLAFGERLHSDSLPSVYSKHFLYEFHCKFISLLLTKEKNFVMSKGVTLFKNLVGQLQVGSLEPETLDIECVKYNIQQLICVMTGCALKTTRQNAVQILPVLLARFNTKGRYKFLSFLLNTLKHPGAIGYTIQMLKNEINAMLTSGQLNEYFTGQNLQNLFKFVFVLPYKAETDILESSDHILACLNLLRYLVLRDKPAQNVTGIWDQVLAIEKEYIGHLRTGLNMSKAHYQLDLDKAKRGEFDSKPNDPECSVKVGDKTMQEMSREQKVAVLHNAFCTFDMIESVLARVQELVDTHRNDAKKL